MNQSGQSRKASVNKRPQVRLDPQLNAEHIRRLVAQIKKQTEGRK